MKIIKEVVERIHDELEDAKTYAELALQRKETDPDLAKIYFNLSTEEMEHMNTLHRYAVQKIQEYRDVQGEPPPEMLAVYNYMHEKQIRKATEVKNLQAMFKEN